MKSYHLWPRNSSAWFAARAALALAAVGQPAHAQSPCPPNPVINVDYNPGPEPVQRLLKQLAERNAPDWANLCKYNAANAAQRQAGRPVAVFLGDSITENWEHEDPAFFANGYVDRGISGQTSAQILLRFKADVVALRPQVVHIMAGTNDIAGNGGPVTDEAIENNIGAMVDLATANGIRVVLASIPPAKAFAWAPTIMPVLRIRALNQWLYHFAQQRGIGYADYYSLLADPDGGLRSDFSGDGVHPQQAGYAVMAPAARDAIASVLR